MPGILFSVVIPVYNKELYIKQCIDSVLCQTYESFEVIVVDDGSKDNSVRVVEEINDSRIRIIKKENGGVSSARNKGIEISKGTFIAFLDADDWYEADYLSTMVDLIKTFPECDAFTSAYNKCTNDAVKSSCIPKSLGGDVESFVVGDFYSDWTESAFFFTSSIVIKKGCFTKNNLTFPINEHMGEDQDVWFNLADHGIICYTRKRVSNYRIASENSLTFNSDLNVELPFISRLKERVVADEGAGVDVCARRKFITKYELELSVNNAKSGNKKTAVILLLKNISMQHFQLMTLSATFLLTPNYIVNRLRGIVRDLKK